MTPNVRELRMNLAVLYAQREVEEARNELDTANGTCIRFCKALKSFSDRFCNELLTAAENDTKARGL